MGRSQESFALLPMAVNKVCLKSFTTLPHVDSSSGRSDDEEQLKKPSSFQKTTHVVIGSDFLLVVVIQGAIQTWIDLYLSTFWWQLTVWSIWLQPNVKTKVCLAKWCSFYFCLWWIWQMWRQMNVYLCTNISSEDMLAKRLKQIFIKLFVLEH